MAVPTVKLSSGHDMPMVGFGLWKVDKKTCADTVYEAIKVGYRLFDGACDYGNEQEAGQGVQRAIKDGIVKREELFIVSKLWNTFHERQHVEPICRKQLDDWGIDYFDLFIVHFPISLAYVDPKVRYPPEWYYDGDKEIRTSNAPMHETWGAMEKLVELGLARSISISNFSGSLVMDLLRYAKIRPATLQIEHHPYLTQESLLTLANEEKIAVTAYSSFGPSSYGEFDWGMAKHAEPLFENAVVVEAAKQHKKTPAQVLLRWATQRGVSVIPKSSNHKRLEENLQSSDFNLTEKQLSDISALNKNLRLNNPVYYMKTHHIFA